MPTYGNGLGFVWIFISARYSFDDYLNGASVVKKTNASVKLGQVVMASSARRNLRIRLLFFGFKFFLGSCSLQLLFIGIPMFSLILSLFPNYKMSLAFLNTLILLYI